MLLAREGIPEIGSVPEESGCGNSLLSSFFERQLIISQVGKTGSGPLFR